MLEQTIVAKYIVQNSKSVIMIMVPFCKTLTLYKTRKGVLVIWI